MNIVLVELNFLNIDIIATPYMLDVYLGYIEVVSADVIGAGATLGALKTRINMQTEFARKLAEASTTALAGLSMPT